MNLSTVPVLSTVRTLAISMLAVASIASVANAATHVKDDAGMFSPAAVQQAEQQLADVQQRGGKYVIVETMSEPPADVRDRIVADASQRNAAILKLAEDRAASARADVYVLINKTPGNLQIAERRALQSGGLPAATRSQIADTMLTSFKARQFDQGLSTGVSMLTQSLGSGGGGMTSTVPPPASPSPMPAPQSRRDDPTTPTPPPAVPFPTGGTTASHGFGGFGCCTIAGLGLLVVLVIAVVRRMGNRNRGGPGYGANYGGGVPPVGGYPQGGYPQGGVYPQQGGYPPQAGGGFGRGVAGGLLGGVLGSVLGNRMSHGQDTSSQSHGGGVFGGGGGGTPQDTGYTGSGGDFGNATGSGSSSSGGDFGSDVGGGGGASDYTGGGGDFGGGGGDSGGGGGGDSGGSSGGDF